MSEESKDIAAATVAPPAQAAEQVTSKADVKKLFEEDFATGLTPIYVNTLGKDFRFREITVMQQKSLSRIMIGNESRKDVIYDAQCQLVNQACADEGFDIYALTEFDRIKLLIALYQANMFQRDVDFTCSECGAKNKYRFDFDKTLSRLDAIDVSDERFQYKTKTCAFDFLVGYPSVKTVSAFHKQYCARNRAVGKAQSRVADSMQNMEYVNLYIKGVDMTSASTGARKSIDLTQFTPADREEILQMFPQDALYAEDGVLKKVMDRYVKAINDSFERHRCFQCGHVNEEGDIASPEGFF